MKILTIANLFTYEHGIFKIPVSSPIIRGLSCGRDTTILKFWDQVLRYSINLFPCLCLRIFSLSMTLQMINMPTSAWKLNTYFKAFYTMFGLGQQKLFKTTYRADFFKCCLYLVLKSVEMESLTVHLS